MNVIFMFAFPVPAGAPGGTAPVASGVVPKEVPFTPLNVSPASGTGTVGFTDLPFVARIVAGLPTGGVVQDTVAPPHPSISIRPLLTMPVRGAKDHAAGAAAVPDFNALILICLNCTVVVDPNTILPPTAPVTALIGKRVVLDEYTGV